MKKKRAEPGADACGVLVPRALPMGSRCQGKGACAPCSLWVPLGFSAWTAAVQDRPEQRLCSCQQQPAPGSPLSLPMPWRLPVARISLGRQRRCCCTEGLFPYRPERVSLPLQQARHLRLQQPSESPSTAVLIPTREGICAVHREIVFTAMSAVTSLKYPDVGPSKQSATS